MSFPRYPSYKDSGVEWLGWVPGHWEVRPLKRLARLQTGMTPPTDEWDNYIDDEGFQWIRPEDIDETGAPTKSSKFLTEKGWSQTRQIKAGASLICCIGTIGKVGITTDAVSTNQQITAAEPQQDAQYLFYAICAGRSELELASTGNVLRILNTERLGNIRFTNPPLSEQTQIAAFLDRETAKIDALVAEQRRLMELLKEKRQAVISHAVTQGLNPDAPMKPSGIEWLGDVPAHWEVVPLKHLCVLLKDGTHLPPERVDDGIPLLSVRNLVDGEFVLRDDDSMISEESYKDLSRAFVPKAEDVLLAIVGATLGKTAVISRELGPFHIQRSVAIFRTRPNVLNSGFLNLVFKSRSFQALLWELVGYSAQPGIYLGTLQNIRIPVPPLGEQTRILESISSVADELVCLTAEAQRAIDLLQERRTALISAAVTGQIDVRGVL